MISGAYRLNRKFDYSGVYWFLNQLTRLSVDNQLKYNLEALGGSMPALLVY